MLYLIEQSSFGILSAKLFHASDCHHKGSIWWYYFWIIDPLAIKKTANITLNLWNGRQTLTDVSFNSPSLLQPREPIDNATT